MPRGKPEKAFFMFLLILAGLFGFKAKSQDVAPSFPHATVVSASILASKVGVEVMEKGGNTIDAAIAVQFALAVVFPQAGNIGGGGFMIIRRTPKISQDSTPIPEYYSLDFREKAPQKASRNMFLDSKGEPKPLESTDGILASGVPGVVDGMVKAHKRFGKMRWRKLINPSIDLAEKGFSLTEQEAASLNREKTTFLRLNGSSNPFVKEEGDWKVGDRFLQPELANTLKKIANKGRAGFYKGKVASRLLIQMQGRKNYRTQDSSTGIINYLDLMNYHSVWRAPLIQNYKQFKIISMAPPSSGGIILFQLLTLVGKFPIKQYGYNTFPYVHTLVEAQKRVFADRSYYLGDPDFVDMPIATLLSPTFLESRFRNFDSLKAVPSLDIKPGTIQKYEDMLSHIHIEKKESEETTHFSIADAEGNAVSVTTTLNGTFGSRLVAKGSGFLLNNEMDDFSIKPGVSNIYGLMGGDANAISPGKRMLSSMTPTVVDSGLHLFMVLGSPGGSTIPNTVFQTILNVLEFKMNIRQAVSMPRFHSQWFPDKIFVEKGAFSESLIQKLLDAGHAVQERSTIGRCDAILLNHLGKLEPGADPRGEDAAWGY